MRAGPGTAALLAFWRRPLRLPRLDGRDVAAGVALATLIAILFREALFGGRVFFQRDVHLMWYTQMETFVQGVTRGEWPLWNPYIGFGQPLWADANAQIAYPPTWANLVLRPWTYYTVFVVLHFLWAGAGLYSLGRVLRLSRAASAMAAMAWLASGPVLSMVEIWNQLAGTAWMPWAALAAVRTSDGGRFRWPAAWGACLAAQLLAGSPETCLLTAAGTTCYGLWPAREARPRLRFLGGAAIAAAIAAGLAAAQWLPSLEVAARSSRLHLPVEARGYWSVHPAALLQSLFPVPLHALPLRPEVRAALFESRAPLFPSLYLGLAAAGLVAAAMAGADRRLSLFLLTGLGLCALVAVGRHTPAFDLVSLLPLARSLRYPVKAMIGVSFCWALLVGMGVDAWADRPRAGGRRTPAVVSTLAVLSAAATAAAADLALHPDRWASFYLAGRQGSTASTDLLGSTVPHLALAAACGWIVVIVAGTMPMRARAAALVAAACAVSDLMIAHDRLSPTAPRALFTHRPAALEAAAPPDDRRLYVYDYDVPGKSQQYLHRAIPFEVRRAPVGWTAPAATALAMRLALVPPSPGVWQAAGSFDRDIPGIAPDPLAELDDLLVAAEGTPAHLALLRIGAVARVATLHREGFEGLRPIGTADVLLSEPLSIFAVPEPLPRAYAVEGARTADGREALRLIAEGAFDPAREVVLADGPPVSSRLGFEGTARVIREGTDGVEIQAALGRDGFVVLVDAFDPGWKADVDGRPSPVLRANVAFRAVRVPKGRHSIAMRYRPRGVGQGLAVTSATLAAALLLGLRVSLRERARS